MFFNQIYSLKVCEETLDEKYENLKWSKMTWSDVSLILPKPIISAGNKNFYKVRLICNLHFSFYLFFVKLKK